MPKQAVGLPRNPFLPSALYWQPRGFFNSIVDFAGSDSPVKGRITDASPLITDRQDKNHALLVAELPGGKAIGDTILVSTADDYVIAGMQGLHILEPPKDHWLLHRRRFRTTQRIKGRALMLSSNGGNYFHWLFDSLPRLEILDKAGYDLKDLDWVVIGNHPFPFQQQTLDILNIPREKIVRCSKWKVLQFENLVVTSMPTFSSGMLEPWLGTWLRGQFSTPASDGLSRYIYLSRRNNPRRRLVNEMEIERLLQQRGFEVHVPDNLTFAEQVRLFASARVIVSPHGAALANIVFADAGTRIIELFHPDTKSAIYQELARYGGLEYRAVQGKSVSSSPSQDAREVSFTVDVAEILNCL